MYQFFNIHPVLSGFGILLFGFIGLAAFFATLNLIGTVIYYKVLSFFFKKDIVQLIEANNIKRRNR